MKIFNLFKNYHHITSIQNSTIFKDFITNYLIKSKK